MYEKTDLVLRWTSPCTTHIFLLYNGNFKVDQQKVAEAKRATLKKCQTCGCWNEWTQRLIRKKAKRQVRNRSLFDILKKRACRSWYAPAEACRSLNHDSIRLVFWCNRKVATSPPLNYEIVTQSRWGTHCSKLSRLRAGQRSQSLSSW